MKKTLTTLVALAAMFAGAANAATTLGFTSAPVPTQSGVDILPSGYTFNFYLSQKLVDSLTNNTVLATFGDKTKYTVNAGMSAITLQAEDNGTFTLRAGIVQGQSGHNAAWGTDGEAATSVWYYDNRLANKEGIELDLDEVYTVTGTLSGTTMNVTLSGGNLTETMTIGSYAAKSYGSAENFEVRVNALAVPEPATATLSLLALAGLAARRRRK